MNPQQQVAWRRALRVLVFGFGLGALAVVLMIAGVAGDNRELVGVGMSIFIPALAVLAWWAWMRDSVRRSARREPERAVPLWLFAVPGVLCLVAGVLVLSRGISERNPSFTALGVMLFVDVVLLAIADQPRLGQDGRMDALDRSLDACPCTP
jgi:uncharacterized membrane protein YidH (DUF202 family)